MLDTITITAIIVAVLVTVVAYATMGNKMTVAPQLQVQTQSNQSMIIPAGSFESLLPSLQPGQRATLTSSDSVQIVRVPVEMNAAGEWMIITRAGPIQQIRSMESLLASLSPYTEGDRGALLTMPNGRQYNVKQSTVLTTSSNACSPIGA